MSETHTNEAALYAALAEAQLELANPKKNKENPHFKSRYADLGAVLEAVLPVFGRHGLGIVQLVSSEGTDAVTVTTNLTHRDGGCVTSSMTVATGKATVQQMGSAITYLRRYGLAAIAGVAQVDDDGNEAPTKAPPKPARRASPKAEDSPQAKLARRRAKAEAELMTCAEIETEQWRELAKSGAPGLSTAYPGPPSPGEVVALSNEDFGELYKAVMALRDRIKAEPAVVPDEDPVA